jgi:hypothetical protein
MAATIPAMSPEKIHVSLRLCKRKDSRQQRPQQMDRKGREASPGQDIGINREHGSFRRSRFAGAASHLAKLSGLTGKAKLV